MISFKKKEKEKKKKVRWVDNSPMKIISFLKSARPINAEACAANKLLMKLRLTQKQVWQVLPLSL